MLQLYLASQNRPMTKYFNAIPISNSLAWVLKFLVCKQYKYEWTRARIEAVLCF